jgi:hypothetical protein
MSLKTLMVDTKDAWVSYPGLDGFEVLVANLSRERLVSLRKSCVETRFDRKTRIPIEEINEKKFVSEFTKATLKDWKGLKYSYLEELMLVNLNNVMDLEASVPYSQDDAEILVNNSSDFDTWLNSVVFDLDNFRSKRDGRAMEKTREVSE